MFSEPPRETPLRAPHDGHIEADGAESKVNGGMTSTLIVFSASKLAKAPRLRV